MSTTDDKKTEDTEGGKLTFGELKKMIADTVKDVVGSSTADKDDKKTSDTNSGGSSVGGGGVAAEVARQVAKLKEKEERAARDKKVDDTLADLSSKVVEKKPVERGRLHKFMGWGE